MSEPDREYGRRTQDAVADVVAWLEGPAAFRKGHGLPAQSGTTDQTYTPLPLVLPQPPIDEQPCIACEQVREHMMVFGLPGTTSRDYRRCLPCENLAR